MMGANDGQNAMLGVGRVKFGGVKLLVGIDAPVIVETVKSLNISDSLIRF